MNSATGSAIGSATDTLNASQTLDLWANVQKVATMVYAAMNDLWSLGYDVTWVAKPGHFHCRPRCRPHCRSSPLPTAMPPAP